MTNDDNNNDDSKMSFPAPYSSAAAAALVPSFGFCSCGCVSLSAFLPADSRTMLAFSSLPVLLKQQQQQQQGPRMMAPFRSPPTPTTIADPFSAPQAAVDSFPQALSPTTTRFSTWFDSLWTHQHHNKQAASTAPHVVHSNDHLQASDMPTRRQFLSGFPWIMGSFLFAKERGGASSSSNENNPLETTKASSSNDDDSTTAPVVRIGIVGGGIAGVSVAHALSRRLQSAQQPVSYEIVVFEADPRATNTDTSNGKDHHSSRPPTWLAATARNANSMVPAAAMHVFSRKSVLAKVLSDTAKEWTLEWKERLVQGFEQAFRRRPSASTTDHHAKLQEPSSLMPITAASSVVAVEDATHHHRTTPLSSSFEEPPPYFAAHLFQCLGPSATHAERVSFVRFLAHFLYYTLWCNDQQADERGRVLVQLAQANRAMYLKEIGGNDKDKKRGLGHSQGFLSVHRSLAQAQHAVKEALDHGEEARLLPWDEAIQKEPHLQHIPVQPLHVVHRPNDYTANCQRFVRQHLIPNMTSDTGKVEYRVGKIVSVHRTHHNGNKDKTLSSEPTFLIRTDNGTLCTQHTVDHLVLAAGTETPLLADQLGVADACPTYPLRGYSLTLFSDRDNSKQQQDDKNHHNNLLRQPFSFDSMYCSSISNSMARMAGFGEFVGYRGKSDSVPSVAPGVLQRYAQTIFKDDAVTTPEASVCFRPISPDDLPLVGETSPGSRVYLHTGHGTLGWTVGLATGDCLAQVLMENICRKNKAIPKAAAADNDDFCLEDGSKLSKRTLSPSRFGTRGGRHQDLWMQ